MQVVKVQMELSAEAVALLALINCETWLLELPRFLLTIKQSSTTTFRKVH